ncbi:MAG: hypothetical protein JWN21_2691 [Sphingomonas bacterium]|uniref:acyltransferase n=1 Tax=Sphingomonas bacterium TaxID=1895847 RepID=UPI0026309284|nr:acyltransferase [Sphingomonas bacterium]MDB5697148.1 hypothetical protein [Sphingomonas bacterium]
MRRYLARLLNQVQSLDLWPLGVRRALLRGIGAEVTSDAMVQAGVDVVAGPLRLGTGCFVNRGCLLEATGGITIGTRAHLAYGVKLLTSTHEIGLPGCRAGRWAARPVTVGDGAWLGAGTIVLPGVTIGAGGVVAAGSVVTADTEPNALYAGVPAVKKKPLPSA